MFVATPLDSPQTTALKDKVNTLLIRTGQSPIKFTALSPSLATSSSAASSSFVAVTSSSSKFVGSSLNTPVATSSYFHSNELRSPQPVMTLFSSSQNSGNSIGPLLRTEPNFDMMMMPVASAGFGRDSSPFDSVNQTPPFIDDHRLWSWKDDLSRRINTTILKKLEAARQEREAYERNNKNDNEKGSGDFDSSFDVENQQRLWNSVIENARRREEEEEKSAQEEICSSGNEPVHPTNNIINNKEITQEHHETETKKQRLSDSVKETFESIANTEQSKFLEARRLSQQQAEQLSSPQKE